LADPPRGEIRVARLVRQLGSPDFSAREMADEKLAKLGAEGRAHLQQGLLSDDPEVRLRSRNLLDRLEFNEFWSSRCVTCQARGEPAAKILESLASQSGNHLFMGGTYGTFNDQATDLLCAGRPFWEAVDEVCLKTDNHVRPHYDSRLTGLVIASGAPGSFPVAYAGPLRAQITGARRVFIEELNYEDKKSDVTHTFQINLQVVWEDRFRLVAYSSQPEVAEAVTDTNQTLSAGSGAPSWSVATPGTRQLTANLRLSPPAAGAQKLKRLKLKWGMMAVGNMATLETTDLTPQTRRQDAGTTLVIESFEARPGGRFELGLLLCRDTALPDPPEIMQQENDVELFDEHGNPLRLQGQSSALTDEGVQLRMNFAADSSDATPKLLRVSYPRFRSRRDVEITFRDVPLPVTRPE
jgi:hypothetical protein